MQLVMMQSDLQKQMTVMVSVPVVKEGKRLEGITSQLCMYVTDCMSRFLAVQSGVCSHVVINLLGFLLNFTLVYDQWQWVSGWRKCLKPMLMPCGHV